MMSYIPYRILVINREITNFAGDPVLENCYRLAFEWANKMGQDGKRVYDLYLQKPDINKISPMNQQTYLICKIECTEEQRAHWDEMQKVDILHNICTMFHEDEENEAWPSEDEE